MKTRYLFIFLLTVAPVVIHAQEKVYNLNGFIPVVYQPASVAWDNDASVSILNSRTFITNGVAYQSNLLCAELPVIHRKSGRRYGGIGFVVNKKDAGSSDLLNALNAGLTAAYHLKVSKKHSVQFGMQGVYQEKRTSLTSLSTGSQWLASEFRFDPEADIGENIVENRVRYISFHSGLTWRMEEQGKMRLVAGVSAFDLNKPAVSFLRQDAHLNRAYLFHAGGVLFSKHNFEVWPQVVYVNAHGGSMANVQLSARWLFSNENPYDILSSGSIELASQYDLKKSVSVGLMLHQPSVSIGVSYNIGVASASAQQPFRNGTEVAIRLTKTLWRPKPATIVIENTQIGTRRNFDHKLIQGSSVTSATVAQSPSDVDIIQKNIEDLSKVSSVRFELDKDFKFDFGKAILSDDAKRYLDELLSLLQKNPDFKLEVIGHTDNVGKPIVNYRLSDARATAVKQYLLSKGLESERVKSSGRGDTEPLGPNDTEENKARNRRVHFIIYVNRQ